MSLIQMHDLTFQYDGACQPVFSHLTLQLDTRWRLGLVGRNGRGKTTLLRLLSGALSPAAGSVSLPVPASCFPFSMPREGAMTLEALEDLLPGLEEWRLLRELNLLDTDPEVLYRPLSTLSGGERVKVQLAALFQQPDSYLLIDEPTDHLDQTGREAVSRYLSGKDGFLLVSHDRAFLDGCADHILSLDREGVRLIRGNFSTWQQETQRRNAWEQAENDKLKKDIKRLEGAARRTAVWSDRTESGKYAVRNSGLRPDRGFVGHKAAKLMKRSKAAEDRRQQAVEARSALLRNVEETDVLFLRPLVHPSGRLLEFRDFAPDYGSGPVCAPVSFSLRQGERMALTGPNGAGKSSLLRAVAGENVPHTGAVSLTSGLVLSYVPQDTGGLSGSLTGFAQAGGVELTAFLTLLRKLGFERAQFETDLSALSQGQKKKALLARSICQSAHLYLWDEPLNYVDVFSRIQIEEMLRDTGASLLLVEHDRAFLDAIGAQTISL